MTPVVKFGSLYLLEPSGLVEARTGIVLAFRRPGLATGWTVRGSKFGVGEIFRTRPNRPWAHPASYTLGTGPLLGVKRPGRGVDHPPHLAPRLKKQQSYTSTPPLGLRDLL